MSLKITTESKLRSFQYKILTGILPTNIDLSRQNIKEMTCEFCKVETDTL